MLRTPSDEKYFHLLLEITPYMCRSYTKSIVISEDVLEWEESNKRHHSAGGTSTCILQFRTVDKETYLKYRNVNPDKPAKAQDRYDPPSCRDFLMNERDYADKRVKLVA